ncbi:MAG: aminotransferase class I/II-fold pyridoxal phosphate-dependent enzyme [Flavobacteriaceae bacterium]|nr:aminotransferase class I/II-fold pyridoxal phosphate-dependent enzyme [Flavobacteriaceae bacterium]
MKTANRLHSVQEYYFSKKLREVRGLVAAGRSIINMGIGSPDLAPSEAVIEAISSALTDQGAHQYQSYQGLPALRAAMAEFYADKFGVRLDADKEILPLMGSKEGIMHISMAFLNPGDEVLLPNPGYPTYAAVTRLVEAAPRFYDLKAANGWFPDLEALATQNLSKVKLMWCSYPHMPTGATAENEQFEALVAFAKSHDILLINDNPYSFVLNPSAKSILAVPGAAGQVLELNSLSKTFNMAGWRVGMLMGDQEHINAVLKVKSNMDSGMFYGIQKGAIAALESGQEWFEALDDVYSRRRSAIYELVEALGCSYDPGAVGMFVWAKLPEGAKKAETYIDELLYDKNIFVAPGTIFGSNGEGYIRFSLCVTEEKIKEAIARL